MNTAAIYLGLVILRYLVKVFARNYVSAIMELTGGCFAVPVYTTC